MANIQELNELIANQEEKVALAESFERLMKNRDFKRIIEKGYFEQESQRLVMNMSRPENAPEDDAYISKQILGIGMLRNYLSNIVAQGRSATNRIEEARENIAYLAANPEAEEDGQQFDDAYTA